MDKKAIAQELVKIAKSLVSSEKSLLKLVEKANKYIDKASKDEISGVEVDSTWESVYDFKPVTVRGKYVYVEYTEPYDNNKKSKDRYNYQTDDEIAIDDLKYALNWIIKCIKKGYKEEGKSAPNF